MDVYNDGQWYDIGVVLEGQTVTLTVNSEVQTTTSSFASELHPSGIVAIGSPLHISNANGNITAQLSAALQSIGTELFSSVPGCFRTLQINGVYINISESTLVQQRISFEGCPVEVQLFLCYYNSLRAHCLLAINL